MRRFWIALASLLISSAAFAQSQQLQAGHLLGNNTAAQRSATDSSVTLLLDRALGSTRGAIIERGSTGWAMVGPGATAGLAWLSNGAGADPGYGVLGLIGGGCNAALVASNGGILYSTASACAILAGTATARLPLLSGASTTPQWGAFTLPASVTSGGIPYFSSASVETSTALLVANGVMIGGGAGAAPSTIATANNGVLVTNGTGVPAISTTLPNGLALGTPSSGVATNLTGTAAGLTAGNVTTNANLTGDVTSVGNATTLANAPVIAKVLTGYVSGAGTISATDSILSAFQKINGNDLLKLPLAGGTMSGNLAMGGNAITGGGNINALAISGTAISGTSYIGLPVGTNSAQGILQCDGSTTNCSGGSISAIGSAPVGLVPTQPQGRLTLTSGVAITTTDVVGATQSIYTPAPGYFVPITTDGVNFTMTLFEEYAQNVTDTVKSPAAVVGNAVYDIFGWLDSSTTTMTIASPAVMSWTANGFAANNAFSCTTTGTFATGFTSGQIYYVISASLGANSFEFSTTPGGSAVNTTGSQSGTITCKTVRFTRGPAWTSDTNRGTGAGTSQINYATLWPTNAVSITNGPAANKGTKLGTIRSNASSQLIDSKAFRWVSNAYNCVPRQLAVVEPATSWTYTTATFRQANANAADQLDILQTEAGQQLVANVAATYSNTSTSTYGVVGIDIDSVTGTALVNNINSLQYVQVSGALSNSVGFFNGYVGLGRHDAIWVELSTAAGAGTFYGTAGGTQLQSGIYGSICN